MGVQQFLGGFGLVAVCICLILAGFLLAARSRIALANRLLAGFLVLTAIDLSGLFLNGDVGFPIEASLFRLTLGFLQMPLFLGYFVAVCRADFAPRKAWAWHLVPFVAANLMLAPRVYGGALGDAAGDSFELYAIVVGLHVQYYLYIAVAFLLVGRARATVAQRYPGTRSRSLGWLTQLLVTSLIAHTLVVLKVFAVAGAVRVVADWAQLLVAANVLGVMIWITFKALLEPDLFRGLDNPLRQASAPEDAETADRLARLRELMQRERPYLDPDLSVEALAGRLALTPRELSELINREFGVRFFDFVNRHRVDAAAELLAGEGRKGMLQVLHEAGFNSKSSFNAAFLKHRGMSPSAWRAQQRPAA